jgi:four helix bundle suffix protein
MDKVDNIKTSREAAAAVSMRRSEPLILPHGGYRKLKSLQVARLVYDLTIRFCDCYITQRSRTHDQMDQAACSGVQNIAEGSQASGLSKKMELKLTSVARASPEELKLDFEDFLRQRGLPRWERNHPLRQELVDRRFITADEVAAWVKEVRKRDVMNHQPAPSSQEIAANATLPLIEVACMLLDRQLQRLAEDFEHNGVFSERPNAFTGL